MCKSQKITQEIKIECRTNMKYNNKNKNDTNNNNIQKMSRP